MSKTCFEWHANVIQDQSLSEAGQWLDEVLQDHPQVTGSATYWVCRALIADAADAEAAFVIDIFEQAVRFDAKVRYGFCLITWMHKRISSLKCLFEYW